MRPEMSHKLLFILVAAISTVIVAFGCIVPLVPTLSEKDGALSLVFSCIIIGVAGLWISGSQMMKDDKPGNDPD